MRIVSLCVFGIVTAGATGANAERLVALDEPGMLQAIERIDPPRHKTLVAILGAADSMGCGAKLSAGLKTKFGVTSAYCTDSLMSDPPKWRLVFRLGDTRYSILQSPRNYPSRERANAD